MRKLVALTFLTLDGVMQAPGGEGEDPSGGFDLEGWSVPFFDEELGNEMGRQMGEPFDLLLGRRTYEIFAAHWPNHPEETFGLNSAKKYVVGTSPIDTSWKESIQIKEDVVESIRSLKDGEGPTLQVHGSGNLLQTLFANDLVDELWLKTMPVTLGKGKRLFEDGARAATFELLESKQTPSGVIIASYKRAGKVTVGTFRD